MFNLFKNRNKQSEQPAFDEQVYPLHAWAAGNKLHRTGFRLLRIRLLNPERRAKFFAKHPHWGTPEMWDVNRKDAKGRTPLHIAAATNAFGVASALIVVGADVDAKSKWGITPLHAAAAKNARETAEWLLTEGADVHAKSTDGFTPLHIAAFRNASEVAPLLTGRGADVHARDKFDAMPLHAAAFWNARETAVHLLTNEANVQAKSKICGTPLHLAAVKNAHETAVLLIKHGADIYAKDEKGDTPLHDAATKASVKVAKLLIEKAAGKTAYVRTEGYRKNTPLHYAAPQNSPEAGEMWDLLIRHGADIEARNDDGETPAKAAEARKDKAERAKELRPGGPVSDLNKRVQVVGLSEKSIEAFVKILAKKHKAPVVVVNSPRKTKWVIVGAAILGVIGFVADLSEIWSFLATVLGF